MATFPYAIFPDFPAQAIYFVSQFSCGQTNGEDLAKNYKHIRMGRQKGANTSSTKWFPQSAYNNKKRNSKKFLKIVNGSQVTKWPAKSICHITYDRFPCWASKILALP